MTDRGYQFCEAHPQEPVQYCSFCLRELRIAMRQEQGELSKKMEAYRESIVQGAKKKDEEWP